MKSSKRRDHWREAEKEAGPTWVKIKETDEAIRQVEKKNEIYLHPVRMPIGKAVKIPENFGASHLELDIGCDAGACFVQICARG